MKNFILIFSFAFLFLTAPAQADEYRPAYLEFEQLSTDTFKMLWKIPAKGKNKRLSLYVNLPDDVIKKSEPIVAFIAGAYIERSTISHQGGLTGVKVTIDGLQRLSTDVLVRIQRLDGTSETARLNASSTSFVVQGAPQFWNVINTYLVFGVEHILNGFDHLLFIACLLFITGGWHRMLITITGFTIAHSITLTLAGLELVKLPIQPIEAIIALSIVFLAREIVLGKRDTLTWRFPILVSSSFGLLHGFGFASALSDIGLPQTEIPAALLAFNVGVEIGQVLFILAVFIFVKMLMSIKVYIKQPFIEKPAAYAVGILSTYWMIERLTGFWT